MTHKQEFEIPEPRFICNACEPENCCHDADDLALEGGKWICQECHIYYEHEGEWYDLPNLWDLLQMKEIAATSGTLPHMLAEHIHFSKILVGMGLIKKSEITEDELKGILREENDD